MDGFEMIRTVRALRPGLHIVAMSGAFGGEFLARAERAGADLTLAKPLDALAIREVLGRARVTSGLS